MPDEITPANEDILEDDFHVEYEPDVAVEDAKEFLINEFFPRDPEAVYYERQILVLNENRFFHWITAKALFELQDRDIATAVMQLLPGVNIRFYFNRRNRYWRRKANKILSLVREFSAQPITRGLGQNGELLFDQALPRAGFMPVAYDTRSYGDRTYNVTEHNLDRIFVRDGVAWGAEIKNTLRYIPKDEFETKLMICRVIGVKPLFIVRAAPKSYIEKVWNAGGYTLVFKYQLYPVSHLELAQRVRNELGIPADAPRAIASGTIDRFLNYHLKKL